MITEQQFNELQENVSVYYIEDQHTRGVDAQVNHAIFMTKDFSDEKMAIKAYRDYSTVMIPIEEIYLTKEEAIVALKELYDKRIRIKKRRLEKLEKERQDLDVIGHY